jgi:murein L,D-transpeptidase YafK
MKFNEFKNYKTRVFNKVERKAIIFNDINILPYPNGANIYQITFKESYKSDTFEFNGNKTLIVEIDANKKIKILTEK